MGFGLGLAIAGGLGVLGGLLSGKSKPKSSVTFIPKPEWFTDWTGHLFEHNKWFYEGLTPERLKAQEAVRQAIDKILSESLIEEEAKKNALRYALSNLLSPPYNFGVDSLARDIEAKVYSPPAFSFGGLTLPAFGLISAENRLFQNLVKSRLLDEELKKEYAKNILSGIEMENLARQAELETPIKILDLLNNIARRAIRYGHETFEPISLYQTWTPSAGQLIGEGLMRTGSLIGSILLAKALL